MSTHDSDSWVVYILRCSDNTLYTGITNNLNKRLQIHNDGVADSAKYTRGRRPVTLLYSEERDSRADATRREYEIKQLSRENKLELIKNV